MEYKSIPEFDKDLKKLLKKFRTLETDIERAKINAIELYHEGEINNLSVFQIPGYVKEEIKIFKLKKFSCQSLKGKGVRSGIRIIYALHQKKSLVEFIEIYFKPDQTNEDRLRIEKYLNNYAS